MTIHPTAVIGGPPEHRDYAVGDRLFPPKIASSAQVNSFVTVDCGLTQRTTVGPRAFLMTKVHIGHDAHIGADCELAPGTVIGGHAILETGVRCGIGVLVKPFVHVGKGARLGMGAVVITNVPAGEVWAGNPARKLEPKRLADEFSPEEREAWDDWYARSRACQWA